MSVAKIGIELEGFWSHDRANHSIASVNLNTIPHNEGGVRHSDGSVDVFHKNDLSGDDYPEGWLEAHCCTMLERGVVSIANRIGSAFQGEFVSAHLNPLREEYELWLKRFYPSAMNQTCGLHVHMSFNSVFQYHLVTSQKYFDGVYAALEAWGTREAIKNKDFWIRLKGDNSFCKKKFLPDSQVWAREKPDSRYCGINYAYSRYKTIELRLLPMFKDYRIAANAIQVFIDFTNAFLKSEARRPKESEDLIEKIPDLLDQEKGVIAAVVETLDLPKEILLNLGATFTVKHGKKSENPVTYLRKHMQTLKTRKGRVG